MTQEQIKEYKLLLKKKKKLEEDIEDLKKSSKVRDFDKEKFIEQDKEWDIKCRKKL